MLESKRKHFRGISYSIGNALSSFNLKPNYYTLIGLVFAIIAFYFLLKNEFLIAAGFILLNAVFDFLDGAVAKSTGLATKNGAYFDTIADRYSEFIIIFGLFLIDLPNFLFSSKIWLMLLLVGSFMTTYAKSSAVEKGLVKGDGMKRGLIERAERTILMIIAVALGSINVFYLISVIVILAIFTNITAIQRMALAVIEQE